jgi:hypothetical protein
MESLFEKLLREKISILEDTCLQTMTDPGFGSFDEYRYNLGYLKALRRVLDLCDEANSDMRKE